MDKREKCSLFGVISVRMNLIKVSIISVCLTTTGILSVILLTLLNPLETIKTDANGSRSTIEKDYAIAANIIMGILVAICLMTLYALWKKIPLLVIPFLLCKLVFIIWLSVYLSVLILDDNSVLDFGPNIYPLRFIVSKERDVRRESFFFPVILFILSLEIIVLEIHSVIIINRCRKSMLTSSSLNISS